MSACDCTPGTEANGWQETRCKACILDEIAIWGHVTAWSRNGDIVQRLQQERQR